MKRITEHKTRTLLIKNKQKVLLYFQSDINLRIFVFLITFENTHANEFQNVRKVMLIHLFEELFNILEAWSTYIHFHLIYHFTAISYILNNSVVRYFWKCYLALSCWLQHENSQVLKSECI
jgi:hypothetical protein